ncbi:hypothetical protein ACWEV3_34080 [Saccharopolyspora sp. NPDC003752]
MALHRRIPVARGMTSGSADATATLVRSADPSHV